MNDTPTTDTFEQIALDAISALTAVILTLRFCNEEGDADFADAVAAETDALIKRGQALSKDEE